MSIVLTFGLAGTAVVLGFLANYMFKRTGIPDIILLIAVGMLLGPGLNYVNPIYLQNIAGIFVSLALVVILFDGGLNMDLYKVIKESPKAMLLSLMAFVFTAVLASIFSHFVFGLDWLRSFLLAVIIGGTSSSIVIPLVNRINVPEKISTILSLESAFTDAFVIIIGITLINLLVLGTGEGAFYTATHGILSAFSIAIVVGLMVGVFWLKILKYIKGEYDDILTLFIVILFYAFVESVGGNGAIFALVFGLTLGNGKSIAKIFRMKDHTEAGLIMKKFQSEVSFFIRTFFFVFLGLIFTIGNPMIFILSIILTLVLLFARYAAVYTVSFNDYFLKSNQTIMTLMLPRGLAAAVLAQLVIISGVQGVGEFLNIVIAVIIATVLIATIGSFAVLKSFKKSIKVKEESEEKKLEEQEKLLKRKTGH